MFRLRDISVSYGAEPVLRVDALEIADAGLTAVVGNNGSGKSTLMSVLARQVRPLSGTVCLDGLPVREYGARDYARRVAYLPQTIPDAPGLDVRELCLFGRFAWRGTFAAWTREDHAAVDRAMELAGVAQFEHVLVDNLSGGQRQRCWFAMMLAQEAGYLLLDEPVAALDLSHQIRVMELLARTCRDNGHGAVVILHDINLAAQYADRIIALENGRIAFDGKPDDFLDAGRLSELFGLDFAIVDHPRHSRPVALASRGLA